MMRHSSLLAFLIVALSFSAFIAVAASESPQSANASDHNRKGLEYYDEAFYQQLPKGRQHEADKFFDLAAAEFKQAIAADPQSASAYRNLGRLYHVRQDFLNAVEAYKKVLLLEPQDVDAYLQLADTYTRLERYAEAIQQLEIAKTKTDIPEAIGKLDGYIQQLRERK